MKVGVVVFPGSNCDADCIKALRRVCETPPVELWHTQTSIPPLDLIVLPGGFSWGDYLRAGAIGARAPIMREVVAHSKRGVAVLGICNGFQLLTEAGLLSGALIRNQNLDFICKQVELQVASTDSIFTIGYSKGDKVSFPIAHQEGQFFCDDETLKQLEDQNRIAFRYCQNPNGSRGDIAGIFSPNGRVMGLMPHPERATMNINTSGIDGIVFFENLIQRGIQC